MLNKDYYVIQNKEGKFLRVDNISCYPCFINNFEFCSKCNSKEFAEKFLNSSYANKFKDKFDGCTVRKVVISLE